MIIILYILLGLVSIIVLLLVTGLFTAKDYSVVREITIRKPKTVVFDYVKLLKNQDYFSKWVMKDPGMKKTFTGTDGTTGFIYAWDSIQKDAGKGEQEIKKVVPGERVDMEIRFERPFKALSPCFFTTVASSENETIVNWGFSSRLKYPFNLMLLFVNFEKLLGKDMEQSLVMLKRNLESSKL